MDPPVTTFDEVLAWIRRAVDLDIGETSALGFAPPPKILVTTAERPIAKRATTRTIETIWERLCGTDPMSDSGVSESFPSLSGPSVTGAYLKL